MGEKRKNSSNDKVESRYSGNQLSVSTQDLFRWMAAIINKKGWLTLWGNDEFALGAFYEWVVSKWRLLIGSWISRKVVMKGYSGSTVFKCNEWKAKLRSFAGSSAIKESACNEGDLSLIPGLERSPGGGHGNPLQYSCLENPRGLRSLVGYSPWGHKESDMT